MKTAALLERAGLVSRSVLGPSEPFSARRAPDPAASCTSPEQPRSCRLGDVRRRSRTRVCVPFRDRHAIRSSARACAWLRTALGPERRNHRLFSDISVAPIAAADVFERRRTPRPPIHARARRRDSARVPTRTAPRPPRTDDPVGRTRARGRAFRGKTKRGKLGIALALSARMRRDTPTRLRR